MCRGLADMASAAVVRLGSAGYAGRRRVLQCVGEDVGGALRLASTVLAGARAWVPAGMHESCRARRRWRELSPEGLAASSWCART